MPHAYTTPCTCPTPPRNASSHLGETMSTKGHANMVETPHQEIPINGSASNDHLGTDADRKCYTTQPGTWECLRELQYIT